MSWQVVMLFQNVLAAVFAINSRVIARKFQRATVPLNLMIYAVIAASGIMYALIKGAASISVPELAHYLGFFIFAGVCFAVTNMLSFVVFQYVDAAIATLLSTLNIVAAVVLSTLLIHEGLTVLQIIGALVLLGSMEMILSLNVSKYRHKKLWEAIALSIIASIFFAFAITTEKYLLNKVNLSTYLVFGWGFQFVGVCLVALCFGRYIKANIALLKNAEFWKWALPASLVRMYSGLLFIFSLKLSNNLSVISVLSGLKVILAALLSVYILQERDYLSRKLEAAVLAAAGIAVIYWR